MNNVAYKNAAPNAYVNAQPSTSQAAKPFAVRISSKSPVAARVAEVLELELAHGSMPA